MTDWRNEVRTCACGMVFTPKRDKQRHCSVQEKPLQGLSDAPAGLGDGPTMVWPAKYDPREQTLPGTLEGDDYPLEYYEEGYPKLPACLDRRRKPASLAEAA